VFVKAVFSTAALSCSHLSPLQTVTYPIPSYTHATRREKKVQHIFATRCQSRVKKLQSQNNE